ncbi:MAG: prepilin-type N-terminal cleavage/methylation domain-containing protein [bacterium]|nr:prepilin-type N-terminal cleavage/methylation domain-containing protein [bacterium]
MKPNLQRNEVQPISFNPGFTLLEILIVLVIVTLIIGFAIPNFRGAFEQTKLESASRNLVTMLGTAQHLSVIHRLMFQVKFDSNKQEYQIIPDSSLLKDNDELPNYARRRKLPDGVKFGTITIRAPGTPETGGGTQFLAFYPNGGSDGAVISLGDNSGAIITLQVMKATGLIKVSSGQAEPTPQTTE